MDATPAGAKESRRTTYKNSPITKIEPDEICLWLIHLASECGLSASNGMGLTSIPWTEIVAWQEATGNKELWIASMIKSLSVTYVSEVTIAKDITRASPLSDRVDIKEQRKTVANQLKNFK